MKSLRLGSLGGLSIVVLFLSMGCFRAAAAPKIVGQGPQVESKRLVESFDQIHVAGGLKLQVRVGEPFGVLVHAQENLQEHIRTEVKGDELKVWFESSISTDEGIVCEVVAPGLKAIGMNGSIQLDVSGLEEESFHLRASGSASGTVGGKVGELVVDCAGSAKLDLFELDARQVEINIAGSGKINTTARESLDVDLAGSGLVTYRGQPKISLDQSGSGRVVAEK
jgi:hypothetical protein